MRLGPLFAYVPVNEIDQLVERVVIGEHPFRLRDLAHLAVIALDDVGRVDDAAYRLGVLEVAAEVVPLVAPRPDDYRVLPAPLGLQVVKFGLRPLLGLGGIDQLQVGQERHLVLAGHILHGIAYLVYHAQLNVRFWEHALDGIGEAGESVHAGLTPRF